MRPTSLLHLVLLAGSVKAVLGPENSVQLIVSAMGCLYPPGPVPPDTYCTAGRMVCRVRSKDSNTAVQPVIVSNDTMYHKFTEPTSVRKVTTLWYASLETDPITDAPLYRINCRESLTEPLRVLGLYNATAGTPMSTLEVSPTANRTEDRHLRYLWNITQVEQQEDGRLGLPMHYYLLCLVVPEALPDLCATLDADNATVYLAPRAEPFTKQQMWVFASQPYSAEGDPAKTTMEAESDLATTKQQGVADESEIPKQG